VSPRPHKDTGWRLFARTVMGRSYTRAVGYQRQVSTLVIDIGLPLLGILAYVFVYRAMGAAPIFAGYVILGGAMTAFWLNVIWAMAAQFFWERQMGNLQAYIMAPTSLMAVLLGMALGGMTVAGVRAAFILVLGTLLFHIPWAVASVPLLVAAFVLMVAALYALGMMCSSLFLLFGRNAHYFLDGALEPVYLISGTYFPLRSLDFWVAAGASLIPLTLGLDAIRQLVFAGAEQVGFLSVRLECAILLVLAVTFFVGSRWSLAWMERRAIEEGKLTEHRA
jgi:ABC-2 type transport system permease protein